MLYEVFGDKILLGGIVQNESGYLMFNLEVMGKDGNISETRFGHSHENEGGVGFSRVGKRYVFWLFGNLSGGEL
jgi:hypothetical protein